MFDITANDIWTFKLTTGEEIVAKVVAVTCDLIDIQFPLSVAPGQQGMGLVPSLFTADVKAKTTLAYHAIAVAALTDGQVKSKYLEATTGIHLPNKSLILG